MKKIFLIFILIFTTSYAKNCYFTKTKQVCLKRFYDTKQLKKPYVGEKYYLFKGNIYTFKDKIKLKLKHSGAILSILEDFEVEFYDKRSYETYVIKVDNPNETLQLVTKLNDLSSVKLAQPLLIRKYRKNYVRPKYEIKAQEKKKKSANNSGKLQGFSSK